MPTKDYVETTSKIDTLLGRFYDIEDDIKSNIAKLPSYGSDCNCDERHPTFNTIHSGSAFDEIHKYCIVCGGIVNKENIE